VVSNSSARGRERKRKRKRRVADRNSLNEQPNRDDVGMSINTPKRMGKGYSN
jgi:hypothetical protein